MEKLRETRGRRHILKDYYLKIKTFLSDSHTEGNFLQQEGDFLKTAEECYKDLKNKKYTVFVAGKLKFHRYCLGVLFSPGYEAQGYGD